MKITKTQISYLEHRLSDIKCEKLQKYSNDMKSRYTAQELYDAIKSGKVKLKPKKDICQTSTYFHACSPNVRDLFDMSVFSKAYQDNDESYEKYKAKLEKAITDIMDRVVLSDLMIEEAVTEFKKL